MDISRNKGLKTQQNQINHEVIMINKLDDLLESREEWTNIQLIIQKSIKQQSDIIKEQSRRIYELEKLIEQKVSKVELEKDLKKKINFDQVDNLFQEIENKVNNKFKEYSNQIEIKYVNHQEFSKQLNNKLTLNEVKGLFDNKVNLNQFQTEISKINQQISQNKNELNIKQIISDVQKTLIKNQQEIQKELELKVDKQYFETELQLKANKQSVMTALKRKINKEECQELMLKKVDMEDIQKLIQIVEEKADKEYSEEQYEILQKQIKNNFSIQQQFIQGLNKTIEQKSYNEVGLGESIKIKLEEYEIQQKKSEDSIKQLEKIYQELQQKQNGNKQNIQQLIQTVNNKMDVSLFNEITRNQTEELWTEIQNSKKSLTELKRETEANMISNQNLVQSYIQQIHQNQQTNNDEIQSLEQQINQLQSSIHPLIEQIQTNENQSQFLKQLDQINQKHNLNFTNLSNQNNNFQKILDDFYNKLESKIELEEVQNAFGKQQQDIQTSFNELKQEIVDIVQQNNRNVETLLENKVDINFIEMNYVSVKDFRQLHEQVQNKMDDQQYVDIIKQMDMLYENMNDKVNLIQIEEINEILSGQIQQLSKQMIDKADSKQLENLYQKIQSVDIINSNFNQINHQLQMMLPKSLFDEFINDQAIINQSLCTENIISRFTWKSGLLNNNQDLVPWEIQVINTLPDNFIWVKDQTYILISAPGLYEIQLGFYQRNKPKLQVIVNNECIIELEDQINQKNSKVYQHSQGNLIGLTFRDYLVLPPRAKVQISYIGDFGAEAFVGFKRL